MQTQFPFASNQPPSVLPALSSYPCLFPILYAFSADKRNEILAKVDGCKKKRQMKPRRQKKNMTNRTKTICWKNGGSKTLTKANLTTFSHLKSPHTTIMVLRVLKWKRGEERNCSGIIEWYKNFLVMFSYDIHYQKYSFYHSVCNFRK